MKLGALPFAKGEGCEALSSQIGDKPEGAHSKGENKFQRNTRLDTRDKNLRQETKCEAGVKNVSSVKCQVQVSSGKCQVSNASVECGVSSVKCRV